MGKAMSKPELTVAELRVLFEGTAQGAALDYTLAQDHDARVEAVQKGVDFACNELEQNKHKKQRLGEDAITLEVCSMLKMAGFQAAHDEDVGGHCDIVIKGKGLFLWLAEAKEHSDYSWLDKGFQQLSTRYSTGVKGQDHGEILVYCYNKDAKAMLRNWRKELEARNAGVATKDAACGNPLLFCSAHQHAASGLDFHVRHKAVALYWDPKDIP
jgi:hypothetical protein